MDVSAGRQNRYSPDGGVDGPSPGGGSNFVSGEEFSTPTGWLDKPLRGRFLSMNVCTHDKSLAVINNSSSHVATVLNTGSSAAFDGLSIVDVFKFDGVFDGRRQLKPVSVLDDAVQLMACQTLSDDAYALIVRRDGGRQQSSNSGRIRRAISSSCAKTSSIVFTVYIGLCLQFFLLLYSCGC